MSRIFFRGVLVLFMLDAVAGGGSLAGASFRQEQDRFPRVRAARVSTQPRLEALFKKAGLEYPAKEIFLRVFKLEGELELWARNGRSV